MRLLEGEYKLINIITSPSRLQILIELSRGKSMYVTELSQTLKMDRSTVSYHLSILEEAGLVRSYYKVLGGHSPNKVGRFIELNEPKIGEAIKALGEKIRELES